MPVSWASDAFGIVLTMPPKSNMPGTDLASTWGEPLLRISLACPLILWSAAFVEDGVELIMSRLREGMSYTR